MSKRRRPRFFGKKPLAVCAVPIDGTGRTSYGAMAHAIVDAHLPLQQKETTVTQKSYLGMGTQIEIHLPEETFPDKQRLRIAGASVTNQVLRLTLARDEQSSTRFHHGYRITQGGERTGRVIFQRSALPSELNHVQFGRSEVTDVVSGGNGVATLHMDLSAVGPLRHRTGPNREKPTPRVDHDQLAAAIKVVNQALREDERLLLRVEDRKVRLTIEQVFE